MGKTLTLCAVAVALTITNFGWQFFVGNDYRVAFDHSFFQAVAVFVTGWNLR